MSPNKDTLQKLFQEYYIMAIPQFAPALAHRIKADPQHDQALNDEGYVWDRKQVVYQHPRMGAIVALPNGMFIWMIGNFGKVLKNPDKLSIWINGRNEEFIGKYMQAMGQTSDDIKFGGEGERSKPYNPTPVEKGDPTDQAIAKLRKQAGPKKALPSDLMISLGQSAKKDGNQKMLDFLKTMNPIMENTIKRSQLDALIREIVRGIVKEGYNPDDNLVYDLADKAWGRQQWSIRKQKSSEHGTVYQLSFSQPHSRFLWKTPDGNWKALDPKTHKWNDIQGNVGEMTTTGAVSPVMTPKAFKKGPMEEGKKCRIKGCGGNVKTPPETRAGLGGLCAKHVDSQTDRERQSGEHSKMINWIHTGKHELPEEQIDEMTTTGAVDGYNVPGAFSKKGGSHKGVEGSAALGYTLTPQGEKEMQRKADKLLNEKQKVDEASGFGKKFDAAQRHYDNMSPPDDDQTIECDECGEDAHVYDHGKRGGYWWMRAKCHHCGNEMSKDNI